ncbi:hypothetical protein [Colwellia sp. BRX10-4]|jgi:hypothetical protein|uniref:hypothetical protein n=1 Tax=Colwellia sp. BRX10-4 TaxID=2759843 RepID=UPI0015F5E748|nr:hypothetical protein [Colwellia sp. BRX10-4]MBA6398253.1 hypothetical protein [Colwellia sp. BRX10-4]
MANNGELLIFLLVIFFIVICVWCISANFAEGENRGEDIGFFDIDEIPLPPNNDLGYIVYGYSQAGSPHGVDKDFDDFFKAVSHIKNRLNKSSIFSVRAYHNKEKRTFQYHRSCYDGRGRKEGRKLNVITISYFEPKANLQSYNAAITDGKSIAEANEIYQSGVIYKAEEQIEKSEEVVQASKIDKHPYLESDIIIEFVGAIKNENIITKLEDEGIYIAKLIVDDDKINLMINGEKVARVSAKTKTKATKFINTIGCNIKVLVWSNGVYLTPNMLCHRGDNIVEANYKKQSIK